MGVKRYNVAIIGTGRIVRTHLSAIRAVEGFNVAGIYGKDPVRTKNLAAELGIRAFGEYEEVLSDPDIQVVDIATSSDLHADYGMEAARHGKNIIVEKPIDASIEKASEFVRLCEEKGTLLGVIYQRRFDESVLLLKDLISREVFGKIVSGRILWRQRRDYEYYRDAADGNRGVLMNNGIHYIDLIMYLLGQEPRACQGVVKRTRPCLGVEDHASVLLEFGDSMLFTIDVSTNVKRSLPTAIEINGERGSIIFWGDRIKFVSLDISPHRIPWTKKHWKLYAARRFKRSFKFRAGSHENVFRNYLDALKGKAMVSVDGRAALSSLKVVRDIYDRCSEPS